MEYNYCTCAENNYPYTAERLKALEQAVPEAFADGKIYWAIVNGKNAD